MAKSSPTASTFECRGLLPREKTAYLQFAQKAFGSDWPQADPTFLDWLYKENPNTRGIEQDLIVLVAGDEILGAHHRMRVPWRLNGRTFVAPSLHDLAVLPQHRKPAQEQGLAPPGLRIMLAALEKEAHVGLFGMTEVADKIYEGLRVPVIKLFWLEKIRSRISAGVQLVTSHLGLKAHKAGPIDRETIRSGDYEISRIPTPLDEELEEALSIQPAAQSYPDWNLASYRWRFFHELGPRNLLLLARRKSELVARAAISVGVKKGILVGRIVDLVVTQAECLEKLMAEVDRTFDSLRVAACLAVTSSQHVADVLRAAGWNYRKQNLGARWFSSRGSERPQDFWISGGAWDFGCDTRIGD